MEPWSRYVILLLSLLAQSAMALEEPSFVVVEETAEYEIRRYEPYLAAEVDVRGSFDTAGNQAFRTLAGYIFGDNQPAEKMRMTAPVESHRANTGIAMNMTAPVTSTEVTGDAETYTYAFVMERRFTQETLPRPLDPDIRIVMRPARFVAARRYSGRWTQDNYHKHEAALLDALAADGVTAVEPPVLARYDAPFKPFFLRRNEVLVDVDWSGR